MSFLRRRRKSTTTTPKVVAASKVKKKRAPRKNVISPVTRKFMNENGITKDMLPPSGSGNHGAYLKSDIQVIIDKTASSEDSSKEEKKTNLDQSDSLTGSEEE